MGPLEALRITFGQYASFSGRASRWEFWWFVLFCLCVNLLLSALGAIVGNAFLSTLATLALILPGLALTTRRLHDMAQPGWWCLLYLVPVAGALVLLIWCAFDGSPGNNRYGPHPLDPDALPHGA